MSVGSYEVSPRPPALAHSMAQWSGARPNWRAAGGSNRGSGTRFFRTASPHTPYISAFLGRPPRPQAPNLSIFWTGLPAGTPKIYPHRWTAFVRIFRGPGRVSPKPTDIFPMRPSFGRTVTQLAGDGRRGTGVCDQSRGTGVLWGCIIWRDHFPRRSRMICRSAGGGPRGETGAFTAYCYLGRSSWRC